MFTSVQTFSLTEPFSFFVHNTEFVGVCLNESLPSCLQRNSIAVKYISVCWPTCDTEAKKGNVSRGAYGLCHCVFNSDLGVTRHPTRIFSSTAL